MQPLFKKNEIKRDIENRGMNFKEWSEQVIQEKRLAILDKAKPYYTEWELEVMNDAYIELLKEKMKESKKAKDIKDTQNLQQDKENDSDVKGGGI